MPKGDRTNVTVTKCCNYPNYMTTRKGVYCFKCKKTTPNNTMRRPKRVIPQSHRDAISQKLKNIPRSPEVIERIRVGNVKFQEKKRMQTSLEMFDEKFSEQEAEKINDWRLKNIRRQIDVFEIDIGWLDNHVICRKCHKMTRLKMKMRMSEFLDKFEPFIEKHKYCNV